ncbi:MAG: preprotein translocase subunit SecY, partial [Candidatus Methanofastidiosia archaeon]
MSYLEKLTPIFHILPEVRIPKRHIPFKEKVSWSVLILALYFLLGEIRIYGVTTTQQNFFGRLQVVLASEMGTLVTLGIGPIVTAGIMMQLLQGAEMIDLDLTTAEGKKTFQGTQKLLAIVLCFFEATMFAFGGLFGRPPLNQTLFIALQMGIGGFLILMMDEVVTKWGFGSGISLFIAGGVSKDIIWKSLSPLRPDNPTEFIGALVDFIHSVIAGVPQFTRPALPDVFELFFTLVVFFIVVYAESMRI